MNRMASFRIVQAWLARIAANVDLTWDQALEMLGFAAGSSPSKDEIQRAYRTKARQNHPDLGGDAEKMVEINAAKEILDGIRRPASGYSRATPPRPSYEPPAYEAPRYTQERPRSYGGYEREKTVISFAEALHDVSIPAGVKWICITESMRSSRDYMGDESSMWTTAYVAVGQTDTQMVLLLMHHINRSQSYIGGTDSSTWSMTVQTSSLKKGVLDPAAVVKGVKALMMQAKVDKPANPTVLPLDEKWTPEEKSLPRGNKGMRMSEFFVELGLKKAPAKKDGPAPKLKIEVAIRDVWNSHNNGGEFGIFVGTRYYKVDWSKVPNKRIFRLLSNAIMKNNYEKEGYYRKELSRMAKSKKDVAKIALLLNEGNYFDMKLPQEVVDILTTMRDA